MATAAAAEEVEVEVERTTVGTLTGVPCLINGLWQIADMEKGGASQVDLERAAASMREYCAAGLDCFDMADHYGSAELIAGALRASPGAPRVPRGRMYPAYYAARRVCRMPE